MRRQASGNRQAQTSVELHPRAVVLFTPSRKGGGKKERSSQRSSLPLLGDHDRSGGQEGAAAFGVHTTDNGRKQDSGHGKEGHDETFTLLATYWHRVYN